MKRLCITIDLEPDYASLINKESYVACGSEKLGKLWRLIDEYDIKLTVFVVAKMLEKKMKIVERLRMAGAEFGLQSYDHDMKKTNTPDDLQKGSEAFFKFFGYKPVVYRTPMWKIRAGDTKRLADLEFRYDSSVFRWWPTGLYEENGVVECPVWLTQSRLKLLGWGFWEKVLKWWPEPETIIYDCHLHDLVFADQAYKRLSRMWRFVMGRNSENSWQILESFLELMKKKGYEFSYLSEAVK